MSRIFTRAAAAGRSRGLGSGLSVGAGGGEPVSTTQMYLTSGHCEIERGETEEAL